jgi:DNA-binding transcriptional LysR family regulator
MMDRLEAMSVLLRVADKGSFSAVSRELRMPLATVSRKVSELEAHLGTRLLRRTTRKVALTDAGIAYAASAKRILEQVGEAERVAAGEFHAPRGELTVTAPVSFGRLHVVPIVAELLAAYPEIDVRLLLLDRNLHLIDDHVDVAVRIGRLSDSGLVAGRVGAMRTVVCASPKLLAAHGTPVAPAELATLPCVNFAFPSPTPVWSFRAPESDTDQTVEIRPRLSVSTAEAAVAAAMEGVGFARVLHYQCADALRDGSLRIVLAGFEVEPQPVHLVHAGRAALPLKARVFLDFATDRLRRRVREVARAE